MPTEEWKNNFNLNMDTIARFSGFMTEKKDNSDQFLCRKCKSIVDESNWHFGYECCLSCFNKGDV